MNEPIQLARDVEVVEIPSGERRVLPKGMLVRLSQSLGGSYTVEGGVGQLFRVDGKDADAIALEVTESEAAKEALSEKAVWETLRTIYDPEIPVNIADMGLIYGCAITPVGDGQSRVDIRMTLTAPGCGMSEVLKNDVERRVSQLDGVKDVKVEVVFDPPWEPSRMSEAARLQLGFDVDTGPDTSGFHVFKPGSY